MATNQQLAVLGDPTRLAIFELLGDGPRAVGELASHLPVSRPAVSQHLKVLKDAGLVIDHAEGTRRLYQLDPQGIAEIRAYFDRFWTTALASFKAVVERPAGPRDQPRDRKPARKPDHDKPDHNKTKETRRVHPDR